MKQKSKQTGEILSAEQAEDIFAARLARIFVDIIMDGEINENENKNKDED